MKKQITIIEITRSSIFVYRGNTMRAYNQPKSANKFIVNAINARAKTIEKVITMFFVGYVFEF